MAGETVITVVGNLTSDPELRYTQNGLAVANFTIASTPRTFDRAANNRVDGETLFLRTAVWRDAAEHVAQSLSKGMRVIASGILKSNSFDDKEGNHRTTIEFEVEEIGPSLRYATAQVTRANDQNVREQELRQPERQAAQRPMPQRPAPRPAVPQEPAYEQGSWADETPF